MNGGVCYSCQKKESDCTSCSEKYTGKTEVIASVILNDAPLRVNEIIVGKRYENKTMYDLIKNSYTHIGIGICKRLNKPIDLWMNNSGKIYGTSKILPYRYFELNRGE